MTVLQKIHYYLKHFIIDIFFLKLCYTNYIQIEPAHLNFIFLNFIWHVFVLKGNIVVLTKQRK